MDNLSQEATATEFKASPGGLLGNVSLLTTGGSSLQQLTNNDFQLASTKNNTLPFPAAGKRKEEQINTSTPARPFLGNQNVVYGFDLSPVHSYEMPSASTSQNQNFQKTVQKEENGMHPIVQDELEDTMFADSKSKTKAAPNFMQAPLVPSPHQSRISTRASDETETMMSQVYSQSSKTKSRKNRTGSSTKKSIKMNRSSSRSPPYTSPRKTSSRLYSHVHGSGYGVVYPWKSPVKQKSTEKQRTTATFNPKKKNKSGKETFTFRANNRLPSSEKSASLTPAMPSSSPRNFATDTYKVRNIEEPTSSADPVCDTTTKYTPDELQRNLKFQSYTNGKDMEDRLKFLENECSKLQAENIEANKEKFKLMAKLNKLMTENETPDPIAKDSLNQDGKDVETSQLKRDILEQERLLKGYQQENERVYNEMAKIKASNRENETAMYNENLKLKNKIASLQEEVNTKDAIIKDKNNLLLDDKRVRPRSINRSVQTVEVSTQRSEKENFAVDSVAMTELKNKLLWYEENQSIFQEKCERLEGENEELGYLREQIVQFSGKVAASKATKDEQQLVIEDLRRQVKELENIMSKSQTSDHMKDLLYGDSEKKLLEKRCEQLEERLKEQERKFSQNLKSLHQLYKKMSSGYEERVNTLSEQLEILKEHSRKSEAQQRADEQRKLVHHENAHLKLQIDALTQELEEKKAIEKVEIMNKSTMAKVKRKSRSNDFTYYPSHFVERLSIHDVVEKDISKDVSPSKLKPSSLDVQDDLIKEASRWKNLYEESKTAAHELKEKHITEVETMKEDHQKAIRSLLDSKEADQRKFSELESRLMQCTIDFSSCQTREQALQIQVRNLLDELQDTRRGSPNVAFRHLQSLEAKIKLLNYRQKSREDKLNQVVVNTADQNLKAEICTLHNTISEKNLLIAKFQFELEAILGVLEGLQKDKLR